MPVTAICLATGAVVESFSVSDAEWNAMRADKGAFLMRRSGKVAVLRENRHGTRWFQSKPGDRDPDYKPESPAHEMTKIWIVRSLRAAGYKATAEQFGVSPEGERWEADAFVDLGDKRIAIEVQMSPQTLADYLYRTQRYRRSGVKVIWLVRHFHQFSIEAVYRKGFKPGSPGMQPDLEDVPALGLELRCSMNEPSADAIRVHVIEVGGRSYTTISLHEFALGIVSGALVFHRGSHWAWKRPKEAP